VTADDEGLRVKKYLARLADGREIVYFDESGDTMRSTRDPRDLPEFRPSPTVRHDALLDEWVGLADHRQDRTYLPPDDQCPLCLSTAERPTEIPATSYDVVCSRTGFPPSLRCRPALSWGNIPICGVSATARGAAGWCASPRTTTRRSRR